MGLTLDKTLSIITATKNAGAYIDNLIRDLNAQIDDDFTWVVVDKCSQDGTLDKIRQDFKHKCRLIQENDNGLYDALNIAIQACNTDYYLVCGADDRLFPTAVYSIKKHICDINCPDIVLNTMNLGDRSVDAFWGSRRSWLGADRIVAGHSVGMVIKSDLHKRLGYYRTDLMQAADAAFIYSAYNNNVSFSINRFNVGTFNISGISNNRRLIQISETCLVQIEAGIPFFISILLFFVRCVKLFWSKKN